MAALWKTLLGTNVVLVTCDLQPISSTAVSDFSVKYALREFLFFNAFDGVQNFSNLNALNQSTILEKERLQTSSGGFKPIACALSHRSSRVTPTHGPYS